MPWVTSLADVADESKWLINGCSCLKNLDKKTNLVLYAA